MSFPDEFKISVSDTQAYQQFSLTAVIPMINALAQIIMPSMLETVSKDKQRVADGN